MARFDEKGREIPDNSPVELPLKFRNQAKWVDDVRRLVATEFSRLSQEAGGESFEESLDFEVEGDELPETAGEIQSMQEEELLQMASKMFNVRAARILRAQMEAKHGTRTETQSGGVERGDSVSRQGEGRSGADGRKVVDSGGERGVGKDALGGESGVGEGASRVK